MSYETAILSIKPSSNKYSKYGTSLDRLFNNNSLQALQEKIKNPKYFQFKEEKQEGNLKFLQFRRNDIKENKLNIVKIDTDGYKEIVEMKRKERIQRNKELTKESPDMCKYNPNYELKYFKSPAFKVYPTRVEKKTVFNKALHDQNRIVNEYNHNSNHSQDSKIDQVNTENYTILHTLQKNKSSLFDDHQNENEKNRLRSSSIKSTQKNVNLLITDNNDDRINRKSKIDESIIAPKQYNSNNKSHPFAKYTDRNERNVCDTINIDYLPMINHLNDKSKCLIAFSKMLKRVDVTNDKYKSPGICYYKPKYELTEKKNDHLVPYSIVNQRNNPRFKVQKLWRSYKVPHNYISVSII